MDAEHRLRQLLSEKSADIYSPLKTPEAEDRRLAAWQYVTDTWNIENDGKKATLKEVQNLSRMFADADNAENMKKCITLPLVTVTILGLLFVLVAIGDHQIQSNACAEITNMYVWCITTGAIGLTLVLFMVIKIVAEKCCVFQFLLNLVISAIFVVQLVSHIIGIVLLASKFEYAKTCDETTFYIIVTYLLGAFVAYIALVIVTITMFKNYKKSTATDVTILVAATDDQQSNQL